MKRTLFIVLVGLGALVLAACGSNPGAPEQVEYTIEMTEFGYSPDTIEVSVGQEVTLHIQNHGALTHELMIGRKVMEMNGQPSGYVEDLFATAEPMVMAGGQADHADDHGDDHGEEAMADEHGDGHGDEHGDGGHGAAGHGFMVSLPGGDKDSFTTITFTVTEDMVGEWEIGCFLDGGSHYTAGMVGTFIVNP